MVGLFTSFDTSWKIRAGLLHSFKNAERVDASKPVYVPGEIEFNTKETRLKTGIPLNDKVLEDLHKLGRKFAIKL